MRAATIHGYGDPSVFRLEEVQRPAPGPRDVLVEVRAAGVNPVDAKMRRGDQQALVRHRMPAILGLDFSGVVVATGEEVTRFEPGDEVFGSPTHTRRGTYAQYVAVDQGEVARKPQRLSHIEAASVPLAGLTALQCLVTRARLTRGERVLVQAGSGGVGTFAIQLAKHLGATVATTCSGRNVDLVKRLGADVVIDYTRDRFDEVLAGYDVALDSIGGEDLSRVRRVLRRGGRLVYIASGLPEQVRRNGPYLGAAVTAARAVAFAASSRLAGVRASFVVRRPDGAQLAHLASLLELGHITTVVERTFPLSEIAEAHRAIESGRTRGKIVIDLSETGRAA